MNITVSLADLDGSVTIAGNAIFGETLKPSADLSSTPAIPTLGTINYQWRRGTTNITGATSETYTLVQADIGSTISVVVTATNCNGSVASASTATVTKATQTAPAEPKLLSATSTTITLFTLEGCEYNRDGGAWQSSPTFTELTPNTSYRFQARKTETATHFASDPSNAVDFSTDKAVTYTIISSVNNTDYGTITPYGVTEVEEGESVTYTISHIEGYIIDDVLVNGASVGKIDTYTFKEIHADGTIHVVFIKDVGVEENEFTNIKVYSYQSNVYIINKENVALKSIEIMDLTGRLIYRNAVNNPETVITLQVATGIYNVRLISQKNTISTTKVSITKF